MDPDRLVHDRRDRWRRLTRLLDRVDAEGLDGLSAEQTDELFSLYRLVSSDLNLVQTRTGNPALLEYLEGLVGRAYANLAVPRRVKPLRGWWRIMRHDFPAALRTQWRLLALAAVAMCAGAAFGFIMTLISTDAAEIFLTPFPGHLAQSPAERVAELEQLERGGETRIASAGEHAAFTTMLFTHNIRVTVLGFALGLTFGLGTVVLLFYNGTILGSLAAWYWKDGVFTFFIAWVGPHGSVELPCILFGCTAGLMLARTQYRWDHGTMMSQLRRARPALTHILIGTATLLVLAGLIEGGFSQINQPTIPYPLKIAVAAALFTALMGYVFWMPVRKENEPQP